MADIRKVQRLRLPPSTPDQGLNTWLRELSDAVNQLPPFSAFSFASPESNVTAIPGTIGVNQASGTTLLWYKQSGDTNTGWISLSTAGGPLTASSLSVDGTASFRNWVQGMATNGFLDLRGDEDATVSLRLTDSGTLLIGSTVATPGNPTLDVVAPFVAAVVLSDSIVDAANKISGIGVRHYTNSEEPVAIFGAASLNGLSLIGYGGGNADLNTVGEHRFYTAINDTTTTGTEVARVDFSTTAGNTRLLIWDVDNATLERVTVGIADSGGAGFKVLRIPN